MDRKEVEMKSESEKSDVIFNMELQWLGDDLVEPPKRKGPLQNIRRMYENSLTTLDKTGISYSDDHILGRGATSIVYRGCFGQFLPIPAAVKRLKADNFNIYSNELQLWHEMKSNLQEENINILTLYQWVEWTDGSLYFCMELADGDLSMKIKNINEMMKRGDPMGAKGEMQLLPRFIHDAAKGLKWIHDLQILTGQWILNRKTF